MARGEARSVVAIIVAMFGAAMLTQCGSFGDADNANGEDASSRDGGATTADETGGSSRCPNGKGAPMVLVDDFCIDRREATNAEYSDFVASQPSLPTDALCGWKKSHAADCANYFSTSTLPVQCVDWCDARAFCAWAGKRLCGRRGAKQPDAGLGNAQASEPTVSEWAYACVDRKPEQQFPYGSTYTKAACNVFEGNKTLAAPESFTACHGDLGIYDLLGNVIEWVDDCAPAGDPAMAQCWTVGDSFRFTAAPDPGRCTNPDSNTRSFRANDLGIRCCADAMP